jgi:protein phosphatase
MTHRNISAVFASGISAGTARLPFESFLLGMKRTRFIADKPLRRVQECVFAVLALESEPIDPRI